MFVLLLLPAGCTVFRTTAVDRNVAVSRDLTLQGLAANYEQNQAQAESCFAKAVESDPNNVEARMLLAESYRKRGNVQAAISQLEQALEEAPDNEKLICSLGECYSASKRHAYAYKLAQLALRKNPENVTAWTLKAQTQWRMGQLEGALADYQRALGIEPANLELRRQMAILYQQLDRPQRALTTLDQIANEYDDQSIPEEILARQSFALSKLNRNAEAVARLKSGFDRGNYSPEFAETYIAALVRDQQYDLANRVFREAFTRYPDSQRLASVGNHLQNIQSSADKTRLAENRPKNQVR